MKHLKCLRCDREMEFMMRENIQLGKTGWFLGDWGNLLAGALDVAVYTCPECGKLEFFAAEDGEHSLSDVPQVTCPNCGHSHDFDYPSCPFCKYSH